MNKEIIFLAPSRTYSNLPAQRRHRTTWISTMLDQSVCRTLYGVANSYEWARKTLPDSVIIQTYQSLRWTNMSGSRGGTGCPDPLGINKDNRVFSDQVVAIRPGFQVYIKATMITLNICVPRTPEATQ